MTELVASYATDRYVLRLIKPDVDTTHMLLVASGPSGKEDFVGGADLRDFELAVVECQIAEDNYWRSVLSIARPEDRALLLSGWEHFRAYAGLPAPDPKEHSGNDQQTDG